MTRRAGWLVIVAALAAVPVPARAADPEPTLIVRVRPIESLMADAKYVAHLVGQGDAFQQAENQVRAVSGIDLKKPLGAYATLSPGIVDSSFAVMLPVTSEKDFLGLLGLLGQNPDKDADGIYTVAVPQIPFPMHFRFANGYAYITIRDKEGLAKDKLLAPAKVFPAGQTEMVVVSVRFDKIPNELRQLAASQLELRLPELLEQKQPGETEVQRKLRTAIIKEFAGIANSLLKDCREIRFHFDLDRATHSTSMQLSLDSAGKSDLARNISALSKMQSPVAGLATGDAAVRGGLNVTVPETLARTFWAVVDEEVRKGLEKEQKPAARALGQQLLKAVEPTLKAGTFQAAGALRGPAASGRYTFVGGAGLRNARALDQVWRNLVKELPPEARKFIALDHGKVGPVSIHQFTPEKGSLDPGMQKLFGDGPFYGAATTDAVYLALGENALEALKQALTLKPATAPLVHLDVSVAQVVSLSPNPDQQRMLGIAKKVFQGKDKDNDRVRFSVEGGDALKVRLEAKTTLLKFFYEVGQVK